MKYMNYIRNGIANLEITEEVLVCYEYQLNYNSFIYF